MSWGYYKIGGFSSGEPQGAFWKVSIRYRLSPEIKIMGLLKKVGRGADFENIPAEKVPSVGSRQEIGWKQWGQ